MEQPGKIYLIDMGDEVVWCDSPATAPGMEEKDAVEYHTCYSQEFDEGYHEFLQEMAAHCECCPICSPGPCDGVLAGGVCDKGCHCQVDSEW